MRILIMDSYAPYVAVLAHLLRRHHWIDVVGQACDSLNGLKLVDELRPDVVLVDYSMPMMDGITFTRLLKSKPRPPKVVLMSFIIDSYVEGDALAAGVDAFIHKDGIHDQLVPLLQLTMQPADPDAQPAADAVRSVSPLAGRGLS